MLIDIEDPKLRIGLLEMRAAQTTHILQTEKDLTPEDEAQAGILADVLKRAAFDTLRRDVHQRPGTLADWAELNVCSQQISFLMQIERETNAEDLKGWKPERPVNPAQKSYSLLFELLLLIERSACEIEMQHPELEHMFDDQRQEVTATYKPFIMTF